MATGCPGNRGQFSDGDSDRNKAEDAPQGYACPHPTIEMKTSLYVRFGLKREHELIQINS